MGIVIVGGGTSSYVLSKELRKLGYLENITIITREWWYPYNRMLLPRFLKNEISMEKLFFADKYWYEENNIKVIGGIEVVPSSATDSYKISWNNHLTDHNLEDYRINKSVNLQEKQIRNLLQNSSVVWATSGEPFVPPVFQNMSNILSWRTIEDTLKIKQCLESKQKLLIVGGSFIALELIIAAQFYQTPFSWIVKNHTFLRDGVDSAIQNYLLKLCVLNQVIAPKFDCEAASINLKGSGKSAVSEVIFTDQTNIEVEKIIIGAGIKPAISFDQSGKSFAISNKDYVSGDLVKILDDMTGKTVTCGSYNQAIKSNKLLAQVLTKQITDSEDEHAKLKEIIQTPYQIKFFGSSIRAQGYFAQPDLESELIETEKEFTQRWKSNGEVLGQMSVSKV